MEEDMKIKKEYKPKSGFAMARLVILILLLSSCHEQELKPHYRALIISVKTTETGCRYELSGVSPHNAPPFNYIDATCGKYSIGETVYF